MSGSCFKLITLPVSHSAVTVAAALWLRLFNKAMRNLLDASQRLSAAS
jgi:hypothetical protein